MVVVSGRLKVKFPEKDGFKTFTKDESFTVDKDSTFQVVAEEESAYICYYQ